MNTILLIIPVVGTISILLGINTYREATKQKPLFSEQATNRSRSNDHHENTPDHRITSIQYCDIISSTVFHCCLNLNSICVSYLSLI